MSGRIAQSFIDDVINRVDIVDLIDNRVPLKKAGREYQACCPFHNEKTPSFTVSPTKQFYHCFGCGAHGTALSFLMEYDNLSFIEALKDLATSVGLELPQGERSTAPQAMLSNPSSSGDSRAIYEVVQQASQFFQYQLRHHPRASRAVEYLQQRGLSGEIARDFGIGYAPPGWDNLIQELGSYPTELLLVAGLVLEKEGGGTRSVYDRFRDRVIFPIHDQRGRVVGFGGRVLDDSTPKYLNSPETPIFHKGKELYGLYEARRHLKQIERLLVVEGYMDVVTLAQFGIRNVVATLGTAVTEDHIQRLFRSASEVVFCFDGDAAGRKAAWRGLENGIPLMTGERQLRFLFLPEGEDPDTMIRRVGTEGFMECLQQSQPLSIFLFEQLSKQVDTTQLDGQARLLEMARPLIQRMPEGSYRGLLEERLAQKVRRAPHQVHQMMQEKQGDNHPTSATRTSNKEARQPLSLVRKLVLQLIHQPSLALEVVLPERFLVIKRPGIPFLVDLLEFIQRNPNLQTPSLLEQWRHREDGRYLLQLARQELLGAEDPEGVRSEFIDGISRLDSLQLQAEQDDLLSRFGGLSETERARYMQLVQKVRIQQK